MTFKANDKKDRKPFNQMIGIYALVYHGKYIYIGQSSSIGYRIRIHMRTDRIDYTKREILKYQSKGMPYTSKALKLYQFIDSNREEIEFTILHQCKPEDLNKYEKYYIELYKPPFNYRGVDIEYIL